MLFRSDAILKLEVAKAEGLFPYEYSIAHLPNVSDELTSRSLSITNCVVVNGYSDNEIEANDFAKYLSYDHAEELYDKSGKIPSRLGLYHDNEKLNDVMEEYNLSIPMPKLLSTSNFWIQLEIAFTDIWQGSDVAEVLTKLEENVLKTVQN